MRGLVTAASRASAIARRSCFSTPSVPSLRSFTSSPSSRISPSSSSLSSSTSPFSSGSPSKSTLTIANNPYKARKVWPPNFKELAPQQQLRFEKKYKRRILMANRAPRWQKTLKYGQLATITVALIYLFFYAEFEWWGQKYTPSEEIGRKVGTFFGVMDPDTRYERRKDVPQFSSRDGN